MKKVNKFIFAIALSFMSLFCSQAKVNASYTDLADSYVMTKGSSVSGELRYHYFGSSYGNKNLLAYCTNYSSSTVDGSTYKKVSRNYSSSIEYYYLGKALELVEKEYSGNSAYQYFYGTLVANYFNYKYDLGIGKNGMNYKDYASGVDVVSKFVKPAMEWVDSNLFNECLTDSKCLSISSNTTTLNMTESNGEYVSKAVTLSNLKNTLVSYVITVASDNSDDTVGICSSTSDKISKCSKSLTIPASDISNGSYTFYIKDSNSNRTSDSNITVSISTDSSNLVYPIGIVYTDSKYSGTQSMVVKSTLTSNRKASLNLTGKITYTKTSTPKTTKVTISKLDIAGGEELPGATLVIKDKDGNIAKDSNGNELKWVSGKTAHVIEGLAYGTYTLTEISAPDGYDKTEETIEFTLSEDNLTASATMYNSKSLTTKVKISKQDITNGNELPGAHLVIKDKDGNIIDEWISTDTPHYIEGKLNAGETYTLTETTAPDGYTLNEEKISFTVNTDGTVQTVVMYNAPSETITEVPKTSSYKVVMYSILGILVIGIGVFVIYKNANKQEI